MLLTAGPLGAAAKEGPVLASAGLRLELEAPPGQPDLLTAVVRGLDPEALLRFAAGSGDSSTWESVLAVYAWEGTSSTDGQDKPPPGIGPLLGNWSAEGGELRFRPRFPIAPGLEVFARFRGAAWDQLSGSQETPDLTARGAVPALERPASTRVIAVYPSSETLPANLLRFYLHFSAPMSARRVLPWIRLVDDRGESVPTAFVEVEGGLWDPQRTRLTLLVHPGRVKRGVGPNLALGPVLEEGRRYRLEISAQAHDADGLSLAAPFLKDFGVGPPDHEGPDPAAWKLEAPTSPDAPLRVRLEAPSDHALLRRGLTVETAAGRELSGKIQVGSEERLWQFEPDSPWQPGEYFLVASPALEDPSGNRIGRPFEAAERAIAEEPAKVRIPWTLAL